MIDSEVPAVMVGAAVIILVGVVTGLAWIARRITR